MNAFSPLFPDPPKVRHLGGRFYVLTEDYRVKLDWFEATIPAGFVTDFASVPIWARWLIGRRGSHEAAALVHDWLYCAQPVSRRAADRIFRRLLIELDVPVWRRALLFAGVRLGGWKGYHLGQDLPNPDWREGDLVPSTPQHLRTGARFARWAPETLLAAAGERERRLTRRTVLRDPGQILDQGEEPECAAYAMGNAAEALDYHEVDPRKLYRESKKHDGYPNLPGTTLPALQIATDKLHFQALETSFSPTVLDLMEHLIEEGPVVVGLMWRTGMQFPGTLTRRMRVRGAILGGHAVTFLGTCARRRAFQVENSHGRGWVRGGTAWLRWEDLPAAVIPDEPHFALNVRRR